MWEELLQLKEQYRQHPEFQTEAHRESIRNLFLYEVLKMTGNTLTQLEFENILENHKPQHTTARKKAYDLWRAWAYTAKSAGKHCPLTLEFVQNIAARVMKHTGREITTTVGRYDSSLGDFRLGEDYEAVYPLADYRKIPALLDLLCRETYARMKHHNGTTETIRLAADFVYRFAHIKPFGEGNPETALLLMNYIQMYRNESLLIVYAEDLPELLNALKRGKISETSSLFENFILHEQIKFLGQQVG